MKISKKLKSVKNDAGFTLIEVLVVISIIGLMASVVLVAVNNGRVKARDLKRLADLKQFRTALEFYYQDNNHYPIVNCTGDGSVPEDYVPYTNGHGGPVYWPTGWDLQNPDEGDWIDNQICDDPGGPTYGVTLSQAMSKYAQAPKEPFPGPYIWEDGIWYLGNSNGTEFKLLSINNAENLKNFDVGVLDPTYCATVTNGQCHTSWDEAVGGIAISFWTNGGREM